MLESKGYRCTAVQNGRVAQEQVKKATPDLVLSDMIMPEMDGIRLLEWMRNYDPEVPVIMVTAIHDISTALEAIRRGAYDYILKPFEKDQLFLGVGRALQHRRLIIENRNYQPAVLQRPPNAQKELVLFEGLEDVVIGPAANGFQRGRNVMDRGDHDHRHFRIVLPHPFQQPDPIHFRHDHVAQDQV